ncbi:MAG: hypothetical protein HYV67_03605 [Candidatus Taylorbacteria bacterium]|nr:hypothetical protein [Candidatus Taylorbacteria bacterium]
MKLSTTLPLVRGTYPALLKFISMPIFRAIGLGLVIVIFQLFLPKVFHSFEDALVATFNAAQVVVSLSPEAITGQYPFLPAGR